MCNEDNNVNEIYASMNSSYDLGLAKGQHRINELENAIRKHRDQRGDDRCWMDDEELYKVLPEDYQPPKRDSKVELKNCKKFIECRHNPGTEYVSPERRIEELEARWNEEWTAICNWSGKPCPEGEDPYEWAWKQLHKIGDDACEAVIMYRLLVRIRKQAKLKMLDNGLPDKLYKYIDKTIKHFKEFHLDD